MRAHHGLWQRNRQSQGCYLSGAGNASVLVQRRSQLPAVLLIPSVLASLPARSLTQLPGIIFSSSIAVLDVAARQDSSSACQTSPSPAVRGLPGYVSTPGRLTSTPQAL